MTPPAEGQELTLAEARRYCRFDSSQDAADDPLLDSIRAAVPLAAERELNRAIFFQRRAFTALLEAGEEIYGLDLEPHQNLAITLDGQAQGATSYGQSVRLFPSVAGRADAVLRVEYDAGWTILSMPADLRDGLLFRVMERYVRRNEGLTQNETIPLSGRPSLAAYQVFPDTSRRPFPIRNLAAD